MDGHRHRTLAAALVAAAVLGAAAGCSSEDVTGEPEDIRTLVEVVGDASECVHDPDADEVGLRLLLRNSGEDDRTVRVTPVLAEADGDETERSLESAGVAVPGDGQAEARLVLDAAPDDLSGCAVRVDGGDPVPVALRQAVG
jgi:hypothetical protein